jgi:monovalent cation:proton antiporter-2 (CPA2) family protein
MSFISILIIILTLTLFISHIFNRLDLPIVAGQILIGIILGPSLLNIVQQDQIVEEFSQIGVILLMFLAGLESNLRLLKKYLKSSIIVASFGIITPIIMGTVIALLFNLNLHESLFFGLLLAPTSVSISVEVLNDLKLIDTKEGSTIIGAAIVDDIMVISLAAISVSLLVGIPDDARANSHIIFELFLQITFFVIAYILMRYIVPKIIKCIPLIDAKAAKLIVSLLICFSLSSLANILGLSTIIGAFVAGLAVAHSNIKDDIIDSIEKIGYGIFIPVFFVSIGLGVEFSNFFQQIILIIVFTIVAIISKLSGCYLGARINKFSKKSSLMIGSGMVSRGEMSLIIAQIGLVSSIIINEHYSAFIIVIIIATIISPVILEFISKKIYTEQN